MSASVTSFDPRIVKIVLTIGANIYTFEDNGTQSYLLLTAKGTKYANETQNECSVEIGNLTTDLKNEILSQTSPYANPAITKVMTVYAGRVSTGYTQVFTGDITNSKVSQPPDIIITLESKTCQNQKGTVTGRAHAGKNKFSLIANGVAQDLGLALNFQSTDKYINNYNHNGAITKQVDKLNDLDPASCAYVDDNTLVVKPKYAPLPNYVTYVNSNTGMVGIPETTDEGLKVTYLLDTSSKLGGAINLTSSLNPSVNGVYVIYKLGFNLANRDTPFYYIADCVRVSV